MRLDKLLEAESLGSRKQVKRLIASKQIAVDGTISLDSSQNVDTKLQKVEVAGKEISRPGHTYIMLHKPQGIVTAVSDKEHLTVLDLLDSADCHEGLYPVGRLDRDTEGLILLTNNGPLGYHLSQSHKKITKTYEVKVNAPLTKQDVLAFKKGIVFIGGEQCQPAELKIIPNEVCSNHAFLEIQEGKFHQVKKMFLAVGKKVIYLKRHRIGPVVLDKSLPLGAYRKLTKAESLLLLPYFN